MFIELKVNFLSVSTLQTEFLYPSVYIVQDSVSNSRLVHSLEYVSHVNAQQFSKIKVTNPSAQMSWPAK